MTNDLLEKMSRYVNLSNYLIFLPFPSIISTIVFIQLLSICHIYLYFIYHLSIHLPVITIYPFHLSISSIYDRQSIYARLSYNPRRSESNHVLICGDLNSSSLLGIIVYNMYGDNNTDVK